MRILVVGGTRFMGRHLVADAVGRGHEVTVLHRGSDCPGDPSARHLHADRDQDLSLLADGQWDATVDTCAYQPAQVRALATALGDRGGRYLLISTISVYADDLATGMDEEAPLLEPLGLDGPAPAVAPQTYGALKVGCERVAADNYPADRLLIVRPTYIVGPYDLTGRFPYWVGRFADGGDVLVPGRPDAPFQYVDARDLAAFCLDLLTAPRSGTFHTMAPPPPFGWADLVEALTTAVAPVGTAVTWVGSDWLTARGVTTSDLPLWPESDEPEPVMAMDPGRAQAAGLVSRPLADTVRDTLQWLRGPDPRLARLGMDRAREDELRKAWLADQ